MGDSGEQSTKVMVEDDASRATTSGWPPEDSIWWRERSLAGWALRRAATASHGVSGWRSGCWAKRVARVLRRASRSEAESLGWAGMGR